MKFVLFFIWITTTGAAMGGVLPLHDKQPGTQYNTQLNNLVNIYRFPTQGITNRVI